MNIKFITMMGRRYLLEEDVVKYFREFADTEDTDTKLRLEEAISNIEGGIGMPLPKN
jgi:hypothetical protein